MTAPITPDERAAMRALADAATEGPWKVVGPSNPGPDNDLAIVPLGEVGAVAYVQPLWDDAEFIAAARAAVPRLLDALDTAEATAKRLTPPCDGGCSYNDGPAEDCSAHGRPVAEVWGIVAEVQRQRDEARAEVARLLTERTAAHADDATCASCTHEYVTDMEKRAEEAEAKIERQRDRLRARDEQVRRLRAEVTRLHALVADLRTARPAPAWDEDTVTEAAAQRGFDVAAAKHGSGRYTDEQRHWATISEDEREMVRTMITAALAVVREHAPVFAADIDGLAFAIFEHSHEPSLPDDQGGREEARSRALDYIQMYVEQGESRATVQAEALRDAADEWHAEHYGTRPAAYKFLWDRADRLEKGADRG